MWLTNRSYLNKSATVPLHWGPGANCPCCPSPASSTGCQIWSQAVGPHFAEWNQIWQQNSVLGPNTAATSGPPGTKIFIHFCHDKTGHTSNLVVDGTYCSPLRTTHLWSFFAVLCLNHFSWRKLRCNWRSSGGDWHTDTPFRPGSPFSHDAGTDSYGSNGNGTLLICMY